MTHNYQQQEQQLQQQKTVKLRGSELESFK